MKIEESRKLLTLQSSGDDGRLEVRYDNRSDGGLVEGISMLLERPSYGQSVSVFIAGWEVRALRDLINRIAPPGLEPMPDQLVVNSIAGVIENGVVIPEKNNDRARAAQTIRDLIPLMGMADAYAGSQEEVAIWKKRALEAEAVIRELPTVEMVLLQADKYRRADVIQAVSEQADLKHLLTGLPTDVPVVKEQ